MASTVNAAIAGFITALEASTVRTFALIDDNTPADVDVVVYDGPPDSAEESTWLAVGYQPGSVEAVQMAWDWAQIGAQRSEETYDILCTFLLSSGDERNVSAIRAEAVAIRDAVAAAVTVDRTLGGAVRLAHLSEATLLQEQTSKGLLIGFTFTLSCAARITT